MRRTAVARPRPFRRTQRDLRVHVLCTNEFAKITVISGTNGIDEACSKVVEDACEHTGRANGILFTTYRIYDGAHLWTCRLYNLDPLLDAILERMQSHGWPVHYVAPATPASRYCA